MKCRAKIRIDEKLRYAEATGSHNHKSYKKEKQEAAQSKIKSSPVALEDFNKDVTTDVELITNDRDITLMFLKNYKFTKYFENKTHMR